MLSPVLGECKAWGKTELGCYGLIHCFTIHANYSGFWLVVWGRSVPTFSFHYPAAFCPFLEKQKDVGFWRTRGRRFLQNQLEWPVEIRKDFPMTYLLSIGVSSCVCFQRVVTRACVVLSRSLSVCRAVCVGGMRETTELCVSVNILLEDKHLGKQWMFLLFVIF